MKVPGTANSILNHKGTACWSVPPDTTVLAAVQLMAEKNIGALLVMDGGRLVGVLSERDYTRKVILKGRASKDTLVCEIMASPALTVTPQDTVQECLRLMTDHRVRHLPVVQDDQVVGVVSIGDLVNWIILAQDATIDQMEGYISGRYPG